MNLSRVERRHGNETRYASLVYQAPIATLVALGRVNGRKCIMALYGPAS